MKTLHTRLLTLAWLLAVPQIAPAATTYFVDNSFAASGSGLSPDHPFVTIQEAVDAAGAVGDTVQIAPGTYPESISLRGVDITLQGRPGEAEGTVISGALDPNGIGITIDQGETAATLIRHLTVSGFSDSDGIRIVGSSPRLSNLIVTDNEFGINVKDASSAEICQSQFFDNGYGLRLEDSTAKVLQNDISGNSFGISLGWDDASFIAANRIYLNFEGIRSYYSHSAKIVNNLIYDNENYGIAMDADMYAVSATIAFNTISMNVTGILIFGGLDGGTQVNNNIFFDHSGG
jgi:nitrous oxidase accessory protein NosD